MNEETFYQSSTNKTDKTIAKNFLVGKDTHNIDYCLVKGGELFINGRLSVKLVDGVLYVRYPPRMTWVERNIINAVCAFYNNTRPLYTDADFTINVWVNMDNYRE